MDTFVQRFAGKIKGVISGFDRIVFKGCLRPLMFAEGAMSFFRSRGAQHKGAIQHRKLWEHCPNCARKYPALTMFRR